MQPFSWSYSALSRFRNCPKQYYHLNVKRDFKDTDSVQATWGHQVHAALAKRVAHAQPLPVTMAQYEPWVDWVLTNADRTTTLVRTEQQLAVTDKLQPCEYFDKRVDPWLRVVADVLKVRGDLARIVDWKTGKVKNDSEQLELSASVVFSHFPEVQRVMTNFVWLQENFKTDLVIERSDQKFFWARMLPQVDEMKLARVTGNFPAKPSGLCIRHCPVTGCPYHGKGNRG